MGQADPDHLFTIHRLGSIRWECQENDGDVHMLALKNIMNETDEKLGY